MLYFPRGESDEMDEPFSWVDAQEFAERPRMRGESEASYSGRCSLARLSAQIRASLQATRDRMRWAA